jgi:hypothetical protein
LRNFLSRAYSWKPATDVPSRGFPTDETVFVSCCFSFFSHRRCAADGSVRHADNVEELFGELLTEKHPTRTIEVRGQQVPVGKYELCWGSLDVYSPKSAEALAAARTKREERKLEKLAEANPLFADQIRAENTRPDRKRRA